MPQLAPPVSAAPPALSGLAQVQLRPSPDPIGSDDSARLTRSAHRVLLGLLLLQPSVAWPRCSSDLAQIWPYSDDSAQIRPGCRPSPDPAR
jgi:hypothetical protein